MRFSSSLGRRLGLLLGFVAAPLALAACQQMDRLMPSSQDLGLSSPQTAPTTGLAVADEPLAAASGAQILSEGGSAADAVATMFFTLSATYPVAAGPGGGGICLVRDKAGRVREFDFLARAAGGGGAFAVPGAVAGFSALQKTYGALPWQRVVAPGEGYAATGFPISHVLALRLSQLGAKLAGDKSLAAEFLDASGRVKAEGSVVVNVPLSETLSAIRMGGADGFYKTASATDLVTASAAQGGTISLAELAAYRPTTSTGRLVRRGAITATIPGPGTGAGTFAASLIANAGSGDPETATVAALRKTLAGFGIQSVPPDLGATGFAALDAGGMAAACAVTLNGPFGAGHVAGTTGVTLAAPPTAPEGVASAFLMPLIAADDTGQVALAGAGSGGPNGSGAIAYAFLRLAAGQPIVRASDLRSTGFAPYATANAIACDNGLCLGLPDPGGFGFGARVQDTVVTAN